MKSDISLHERTGPMLTTTLKRRTKGCEQCRKRRVKCDETAEYCKQCQRLGLQCSGPIVGTVFVDMTNTPQNTSKACQKAPRKIAHPAKPKTSHSTQKKAASKVKGSTATSETTSSRGTLSKPYILSKSQSEAVEAFFSKESIPIILTFDSDPLFMTQQLFLAQFMDLSRPCSKEHYACTTSPWMLTIQEQKSCASIVSFKHSIRAASAAFHAFMLNDTSEQNTSFQWYVAGLETYRAYLSSKPNALQKGNKIPGIEEILIPVFLCMFEIVNCTTAAGCFQHLLAACHILSNRGPENCQTGIVHEMFLSLRVSDACIAVINGRPSIFGTEEWRTTPFLLQPTLPPLHYLINILLQITDALVVNTKQIVLSDLLTSLPNFYRKDRALLEERCVDLLKRLSTWWLDFEFENSMVNYEAFASVDREGPQQQYSPTTFVFANPFTAFVVSVYDAASLILHTTLHGVSSLPCSSHLAQAMSHAESILLISKYQQENCPIGFDLIRSTFALKVVENMGPGPQLREKAARIALGWENRGLLGILAANMGAADHRGVGMRKSSYLREELLGVCT